MMMMTMMMMMTTTLMIAMMTIMVYIPTAKERKQNGPVIMKCVGRKGRDEAGSSSNHKHLQHF